MRKNGKTALTAGIVLLIMFIVWTILIQTVDVQPAGVNGTALGFSSLNVRFHRLTGVHMEIYTITDWLGLVPFTVCAGFGVLGLVQWIKRRNMWKVDTDILILGLYYILVIAAYVIFQLVPLNYRPVLIEGCQEASYPSSTVLLVLSVMPTLVFQIRRRTAGRALQMTVTLLSVLFSACMAIGRLLCGVHWITDIIGAFFLSCGYYLMYKGIILLLDSRKTDRPYGTP